MIKVINKFLVILIFLSARSFSSEPYVIGHLMGQLGNQMFIVAATVSLALDHGATPLFPEFKEPGDPIFKFPINYEKIFFSLETRRPEKPVEFYYYEPQFTYDPIPYQPNMAIFGWFQSEKYFVNHKEEILQLFSPSQEIISYLENKYEEIIHHPNTVAIHFRSYLLENVGNVYPTYGMEYYEKAMALFPKDSLFVVFSNCMQWCKEHFSHLPYSIRFIEGEEHYHDLFLMSMCKHQIICNSSFSWWAAYLNRNPGKRVIVPHVWFCPEYNHSSQDLIPGEWTILP
ncbi:MAG TPA: alpha-1,2-fucosyltransferase [Rhabdochlamydiaceae bacterium]|nr:alpha-1,2-fucosyltransferase [Rhabdochlamydiaceae bacterium]